MSLDHFLELRFEGFARIVDSLDGLPVDLPEPLSDPKAELDVPGGAQVPDVHDPNRVVPAAEAEEVFHALSMDVPAPGRAEPPAGDAGPAADH